MSDFNSLVVTGTVKSRPRLEEDPDGNAHCQFYLESEDMAIQVQAKKKLAETCARFLVEGRRILVMGRLITTDRIVGVMANIVQFLSKED